MSGKKSWFKRCYEGISGGVGRKMMGLAAAGLLALAGTARAQAGEPCNDCGPLDVVFIVDDTGSMGGSIAGIQAGIANIIAQIRCASDNDYQLGLITHSDCVQIDVQLAPGNDAAMLAAVAGLAASGGGGVAEASDASLNAAVNSLPAALNCCQDVDFTGTWRPGATKIVILITDAVPGGCDDMFTLGVDDVNANQYALDAATNGIYISAINVLAAANPTLVSIMQNYATVTGGSYTEAPNGVGIEAAISTILDDCGGGEPCATASDVVLDCDPEDPGMVHITFTVNNNSGEDAHYLLLTPQSPSPLDVMFVPNIVPVVLPAGGSTTVSVSLVDLGSLGGLTDMEICFTVSLKQSPFELCDNCCSVQICVTADCDCFQLIESSIECLSEAGNEYSWTFNIVNLSGEDVHHLYFFTPGGSVIDTPSPADNYIYFNPAIPNGGATGPTKVVIKFPDGEVPPADYCIWLSLNDALLNACCKKQVCLELPDCHGFEITGACCLYDGTGCVVLTKEECEAVGLYLGDGVPCDATTECATTVFGACCLPDGVCINVLHQGDCIELGGTFYGVGVPCGTPGIACGLTATGACCLGDVCLEMPAEECIAMDGYFFGAGTDCGTSVPDMNCRSACCVATGCFYTMSPAQCAEAGGVYGGPGSFCTDCASPVLGDGNGDGVVNADDLSGLLAAFGSNNPLYDLNGDGIVNADDLAILLANFGVGIGG